MLFADAYRQRRKDPHTVLLTAIVGLVAIPGAPFVKRRSRALLTTLGLEAVLVRRSVLMGKGSRLKPERLAEKLRDHEIGDQRPHPGQSLDEHIEHCLIVRL